MPLRKTCPIGHMIEKTIAGAERGMVRFLTRHKPACICGYVSANRRCVLLHAFIPLGGCSVQQRECHLSADQPSASLRSLLPPTKANSILPPKMLSPANFTFSTYGTDSTVSGFGAFIVYGQRQRRCREIEALAARAKPPSCCELHPCGAATTCTLAAQQ